MGSTQEMSATLVGKELKSSSLIESQIIFPDTETISIYPCHLISEDESFFSLKVKLQKL